MARARRKKCRERVEVGKALWWHPHSGAYEVCITPTQWARLFPEGRGKELGCGAFACAWEQSPNADTVVKITRDRDDVVGLLSAQGSPRVAEVEAVYRLERSGTSLEPDNRGKSVPVYALVMERLRPVPRGMGVLLKRFPLEKMADDYTQRAGPRANFRVSTNTRIAAEAACHDVRSKRRCRDFVNDLVDTYEELARKGVVWLDMHSDNFGIDRDGRWKILDLGNSLEPVRGRPKVVALRGRRRVPRRRWRRRR